MWKVCRSCCVPGGTHYIKVSGPRFSGKTSIVQWLASRKPINPALDERPTEGTEISKAAFDGTELIIYDCENYDEEDYGNPKWINLPTNSVQLKQPTGIIYVVDGSDPGRLALAMKILRDVVERLYTVEVILILVTKADLFLNDFREANDPLRHRRGSTHDNSSRLSRNDRRDGRDGCDGQNRHDRHDGHDGYSESTGGRGSTQRIAASAAAVMSMLAESNDDPVAPDSTTLARAVQSPNEHYGGQYGGGQYDAGAPSGMEGNKGSAHNRFLGLHGRSPTIGGNTHRNDGGMMPIAEQPIPQPSYPGPAGVAAGVGNYPVSTSSSGVRLTVIAKIMNHPSLMQKNWSAYYVSAVTGAGLEDAFSWFVAQLQATPKSN